MASAASQVFHLLQASLHFFKNLLNVIFGLTVGQSDLTGGKRRFLSSPFSLPIGLVFAISEDAFLKKKEGRMFNSMSDTSLAALMAVFHLALLAVPLLIYMVRLEMQSWRQEHPEAVQRRQERAVRRRPAIWHPHPVT